MPLAKHDRFVDKATDLDVVYMLRHQVVSMCKCMHDELLLSLSEQSPDRLDVDGSGKLSIV